jgi:hypothetical protein
MSLDDVQKEIRRPRFASSDVGSFYGVDPFKTFAQVVTGKLFPVEEVAEDHQDWGHDKEPAILANFARRSALEPLPIPPPKTFIHPEYDWLCATPDAINRTILGLRRMAEAKNVAVDNPLRDEWGRPGTDEVPPQVITQVTITLGILLDKGLVDDEEADVVPSIMGRVPPVPAYVVRFDRALFERFAGDAYEMKEKYLDRAIIPELDGSGEMTEYLRRRWSKHDDDELLAPTPEALALLDELLALERQEKILGTEGELLQQKLMVMIGSAAGIQNVASWRKDADSMARVTDWLAVTGELAGLGISPHTLKKILDAHTEEKVTRVGPRKFIPVRPPKKKGTPKPTLVETSKLGLTG